MKSNEDRRFIARVSNMIGGEGALLTIGRDETSLWDDGKRVSVDLCDHCLDPETFLFNALRHHDYMRVGIPSPNSAEPIITTTLTSRGARLARHIRNPIPDREETGYDGLLGLDEHSIYTLLTEVSEQPAADYALIKWNTLYDTTLPVAVNDMTLSRSSAKDRFKLIACRVISRDPEVAIYSPLSVECTGPIRIWSKDNQSDRASYKRDLSHMQAMGVAAMSSSFDRMTLGEQEDTVAALMVRDMALRTKKENLEP